MLKRFDISNYRTRLTFLGILMIGVIGSMVLVFIQNRHEQAPVQKSSSVVEEVKPLAEPKLITTEAAGGLLHPWDMVFLPDNSLLFNERSGLISRLSNGKKETVADINDVYAVGEGGLTGLALDSKFAENRYIYTCFNARTASGLDVRLVRWKLSADNTKLEDRSDIVTGIPSNASGRHSGCRVRVAKDGHLWVGTGDAAKASNPQDPKSLGGKILHITRDGMPAGNNLPAPFDPRIFSYGHRNVQGIVLFDEPKDDVYGYSVEHGSDKDDEVNLLKNGNFGWAPKVTYVENGIPMTDLARFPDAVSAIWSSGSPTIAPSGAAQLKGEKWGTYNGAVAVAVLKGKQIKILQFDTSYKLAQEKTTLGEFGRIRSVAQDLNGDLYLSTDNGSNDKIIKITPTK
jgi:glucose/arabinose dehydrogenase